MPSLTYMSLTATYADDATYAVDATNAIDAKYAKDANATVSSLITDATDALQGPPSHQEPHKALAGCFRY